MNNIVFSKFSNERSRAFAIRTDILADEAGNKRVCKTACYPQGAEHVEKILLWSERLSQLFAGTGISVNRAQKAGEGSVFLEYLEGGQTLEERMYELISLEKKTEALALLQKAADIFRARANVPFVQTEDFTGTFGVVSLPDHLLCLPVTDIDMVPENFLLTEEGSWTLIDYEWTFDFPVPVNFVIYRCWNYFLNRCLPSERDKLERYCEKEGMTAREIAAYENMERAFQDYVSNGHRPLRELLAEISPGSSFLTQSGASGSVEGGFRSTLTLSDKEGHTVWSSHAYLAMEADGAFAVEFDLQSAAQLLDAAHTLRWDPLEGRLCRIRIGSVTAQPADNDSAGAAESLMEAAAVNGFEENGEQVFWTEDPVYHINGDFSGVQILTVRGRLTLLKLEELLPEFVQTRLQKDAFERELANVRRELQATVSTKGYRALEKLRSVRRMFKV